MLSLSEQHGTWCAVWPCHVSVISCGTGKLGPVQWVLGHSQGKVAWVALSTSSHPRPRLKRSRCIPLPPFCAFMAGYTGNFIIYCTHEWAIRKQNAFKKAMLFHNLMKVYWSCIILMLNSFLGWTQWCNFKRPSCFPVSNSKLKIQMKEKFKYITFHPFNQIYEFRLLIGITVQFWFKVIVIHCNTTLH